MTRKRKAHQMIKNEEPEANGYKCPKCSQTFLRGCGLASHMRRHAPVVFKCKECDYSCKHKYAFDRHLEQAHGQEVDDDEDEYDDYDDADDLEEPESPEKLEQSAVSAGEETDDDDFEMPVLEKEMDVYDQMPKLDKEVNIMDTDESATLIEKNAPHGCPLCLQRFDYKSRAAFHIQCHRQKNWQTPKVKVMFKQMGVIKNRGFRLGSHAVIRWRLNGERRPISQRRAHLYKFMEENFGESVQKMIKPSPITRPTSRHYAYAKRSRPSTRSITPVSSKNSSIPRKYKRLRMKSNVAFAQKIYVNSDRYYLCRQCPYTTWNVSSLWRHFRHHTQSSKKGYSCIYCTYTSIHMRSIDQHRKMHTKSENDVEFQDWLRYERHVNKSDLSGEFDVAPENIPILFRADTLECSQTPNVQTPRKPKRTHRTELELQAPKLAKMIMSPPKLKKISPLKNIQEPNSPEYSEDDLSLGAAVRTKVNTSKPVTTSMTRNLRSSLLGRSETMEVPKAVNGNPKPAPSIRITEATLGTISKPSTSIKNATSQKPATSVKLETPSIVSNLAKPVSLTKLSAQMKPETSGKLASPKASAAAVKLLTPTKPVDVAPKLKDPPKLTLGAKSVENPRADTVSKSMGTQKAVVDSKQALASKSLLATKAATMANVAQLSVQLPATNPVEAAKPLKPTVQSAKSVEVKKQEAKTKIAPPKLRVSTRPTRSAASVYKTVQPSSEPAKEEDPSKREFAAPTAECLARAPIIKSREQLMRESRVAPIGGGPFLKIYPYVNPLVRPAEKPIAKTVEKPIDAVPTMAKRGLKRSKNFKKRALPEQSTSQTAPKLPKYEDFVKMHPPGLFGIRENPLAAMSLYEAAMAKYKRDIKKPKIQNSGIKIAYKDLTPEAKAQYGRNNPREYLMREMRIEQSGQCADCPYHEYKDLSKFRLHRDRHYFTAPHKCMECNYAAYDKMEVNFHMYFDHYIEDVKTLEGVSSSESEDSEEEQVNQPEPEKKKRGRKGKRRNNNW